MRFITALLGGSPPAFRLWLQRRERGSTLWVVARLAEILQYMQWDRISRQGIWKVPVRPAAAARLFVGSS